MFNPVLLQRRLCFTLCCCREGYVLRCVVAEKLPFSIRVLLESAVRNCDNFQVCEADVERILDWERNQDSNVEIPFRPARVILQDFTSVTPHSHPAHSPLTPRSKNHIINK